VRGYLPAVRDILDWFRAHRGEDGLLGPLPYWCFCDWTGGWAHGTPPGADEGGSALLSLLLAQACGWSADLHAAFGLDPHVQQMRNCRGAIEQAVQAECWDASRQAYADTPLRRSFSVHVQIQAILNGLEEGKAAQDLLLGSAADLDSGADFTPLGTPYWYYYLFLAMAKTDLGGRALELMGPWQRMLDDGMTTCTEVFGESRSDCHAWGSTPNILFLTTVLGIQPARPGFRSVRIEPHLGPLTALKGSVPTVRGPIHVEITPPAACVQLPDGTEGIFVWQGRQVPLHPGPNSIRLD
jgi:alpha-L-rhamnosidase